MAPDQARFLFRFLFPQLQSEQAVTKKILSAVPADQTDYQPHPKAMNALQLSWHIAVCEIWFLDAVIHLRFGETEAMPGEIKTAADVSRWYDESFSKRVPLLESLSAEHLMTPVDFLGLRNDPAAAYLNIAIRHSVHHRGQLSTHLRAMGAQVPAIYVESADEPFPPTDEDAEPRMPPAF